jgi:hypothetical protein
VEEGAADGEFGSDPAQRRATLRRGLLDELYLRFARAASMPLTRLDGLPCRLRSLSAFPRLCACLDGQTWSPREWPAASEEGALDPSALADVFLALRDSRGTSGAYFTPPPVVDFMCREAFKACLARATDAAPRTIERLVDQGDAGGLTESQAGRLAERLRTLRAIDPACGSGAFLVGLLATATGIWRALHAPRGSDRATAGPVPETGHASHGLYGIELDPEAAGIARRRLALALWVLGVREHVERDLGARIAVGDALARRPALTTPGVSRGRETPGPQREEQGPFDLVLVNPPYGNMVAMVARDPARRRELRDAYATARGGFDLFVPFIEHSLDLLAEDGVLAALTPDKLLSAPYAAALRERYRAGTELLAIADLTGARAFAAGVYPVVTIGRRGAAGRPRAGRADGAGSSPKVRIWRAAHAQHSARPRTPGGTCRELKIRCTHEAPAAVLDRTQNTWVALLDPECDGITRSLEGLPRLAELADVCGAATVAEAYAWQPAIVDHGGRLRERDPGRYAPFVVSGSIGVSGHTWDSRPVRYLGRRYHRPVLDLHNPAVSPRRRRQIEGAKIILSGLARRPTCVWDEGGLAAAKSTVLVIPRPGVRGVELAALLNDERHARIYRLFFGALALSGGYLRFGPPQLRALPIAGLRRS